ncbi:MAG TPA: hypothetical protein VER04_16050, partial [Polyangiaceae bacterium]|nr:hypothetical protein [Polyangiaceae bacterium]
MFLLAGFSILCGMAFSGCSKSECLQEDCSTSPPEAGAGRSASAGSSGQSGAGAPATISGKPCIGNAECSAEQGQACVAGTCRVACTSHFDCQGFGECTSEKDANGVSGHFCDLARPQKRGQFYTRCPAGNECDAANDFFCIGAG